MIEGVINGIFVGLGVGAGILISRLFVRPFIKEKIRPHYINLKKQYKRLRHSDNYYRALSSEELLWADDAASKMVAETSKGQKLGFIAGTVSLIVGLLVFLLCAFIFCGITMALIKAWQPEKLLGALSWYRVETVGSSTILAIFVAIFFTGWLCVRVFLLTTKPARHLKTFFGDSYRNSSSFWKSEIYELILKRTISIDMTADMNLIGKAPFKRYSNLWGRWAIILSGLVLILLMFDLRNNTVIYKDYIDHSPSTSLLTRSYSAQDIVEVKRTCHIVVKAENQSRPRANLHYQLVMSDGRKVKIYGREEGANTSKQIQALEYWHETISADKFTPIKVSTTHKKEINPTKHGCASVLKCNCSLSNYNSLVRIFDLRP